MDGQRAVSLHFPFLFCFNTGPLDAWEDRARITMVEHGRPGNREKERRIAYTACKDGG